MNQKEILEIRNTVRQMKNVVNELFTRHNTNEEKSSELGGQLAGSLNRECDL